LQPEPCRSHRPYLGHSKSSGFKHRSARSQEICTCPSFSAAAK
jgi:hypothetical protein